jgi:hypothetical protein
MSFKKGDKVRLTGTEWANMGGGKDWTGKIVKIRKLDEVEEAGLFSKGGEDSWYVYDDNSDSYLFEEWGGERVEINPGALTKVEDSHLEDWSSKPKPKFEVGDVVRVKNVNSQAWADGLVYTIGEVVTDRPISWDFDRKHPEWYQIYYDGLSSGHYAGPNHNETAAIWEENLVLDLTAHTDQENLIALSKWIDAGNDHRDPEAITWGRLAKIMEEGGEVIEAYIGRTGQNPRKGVTHTTEDVLGELLDVAITALGAYEHLDNHRGESIRELSLKLTKLVERAGINA